MKEHLLNELNTLRKAFAEGKLTKEQVRDKLQSIEDTVDLFEIFSDVRVADLRKCIEKINEEAK